MKSTYQKVVIGTTLLLSGCGLFQTPPPPTPHKIGQNLARISPGSVINVVAMVPMDTPNPSQPKVVNSAAFRVADNVQAATPDKSILIPQNAFITGIYSNDGSSCQVSWQEVFQNYRTLETDQGALSIASLASNSSCDPKQGIHAGQLININFK